MTTQPNRILGYTSLCWEVSAVGKTGTVRVFAVNQYNAERDGAIKLGAPQWLCTARLAREDSGLRSLKLA